MNDVFSIALLTLHFTAANVAVGGPVLALWLDRRAARGDAAADRLGRRLLRLSLVGLYVGSLLGVAAAYVWWRGAPAAVERAFRALPRSRYEFGVAELIFSAICWEIWLRLWSGGKRRKLGWWLGFAGTTNVVYHFPTLFAALSVLATRLLEPGETLRFVTLLADAEVLTRTFHFLMASLAVAGAVMAWWADSDEQLKRRGALVALVATVLQWPLGISVLLSLPGASRNALLGDELTATAVFGLSLGAVVVLMHHLAAAAFGTTTRRELRTLLVWLGLTIVLMTAVRQAARHPLYHASPIGIMNPVFTASM